MYASASPRARAASALASGAIVALILAALVFGLRVRDVLHSSRSLISVVFDPEQPKPPPEPKVKPKPATRSAPNGDPSPRNLRNKAAQVVAPPPRIMIAVPPPVPVATQKAGLGSAAQTGASDRAGPGQGAGGYGNGYGGGGYGGDGDGRAVAERQIRGKLSYNDLPEDVLMPGRQAAVGVRYFVNIDGRVSGCLVDEPSGYPGIDAMTCRLIEQRFVFRPALDRAGRPVRVRIAETHTWFSRERRDDE